MQKLIVIALIGLLCIAAAMSSGAVAQNSGPEATIDQLKTRVVELKESVEKRDAKIDAQSTEIANLKAEANADPTVEPTPQSQETSGEGSAIFATGVLTLPEASSGQIEVVASGPADGSSVSIVVHNATGNTMFIKDVYATGRDSAGGLVASGSFATIAPYEVPDGTYAVGYIYFGIDDLPADLAYEFEVDASTEPARFGSYVNLTIDEFAYGGNGFAGTVTNSSGVATGSAQIIGVCFGADGTPYSSVNGYSAKDELEPGETSPFDLFYFSDFPCDVVWLGAIAYED